MIRIKTILPKEEKTTPERRKRIAETVARYLPEYHVHKREVPYHTMGEHGAYVVDGHNDWRVHVDDDDSQVFTLNHRHPAQFPGREFALANWIIENNHGWKILAPTGHGFTASIDVEFKVSMPKGTPRADADDMTFEIPLEKVVVFVDGNPLPGAHVVGYTTGQYAEVVDE